MPRVTPRSAAATAPQPTRPPPRVTDAIPAAIARIANTIGQPIPRAWIGGRVRQHAMIPSKIPTPPKAFGVVIRETGRAATASVLIGPPPPPGQLGCVSV